MTILKTYFSNKSIILTTILIIFIFLPVLAHGADVNISPSSVNVSSNTQFNVSINISNVSNLFGSAFDLIYNPSVLSFVSVQKGTFLEQAGATTDLLALANPPGDLIIGYSRQAIGGIASGVNGSGTLMTITFRALAAGTSNLTFQNNSLCDPTGFDCVVIPANWTNGTVTVATASDSTPPAPPSGITIY